MDIVMAVLLLATGIGAGFLLGRSGAGRLGAERDAAMRERDAERADRTRLDERASAAEAESAGLRAALAHERTAAVDKLAMLEQTQAQLREAFGSLSAEALARNNAAFVEMAGAHLKQASTEASGDLARRQQAIDELVSPLRDSLTKVESQLQQVERARIAAYSGLQEQVRAMSQSSDQLKIETAQLVTALRAPQVRGRWGEMQLRRVVESAGMVEHCDFSEQVSVGTVDGGLRPDLVVRLAGGKNVVVDSKVAFNGYLEAMEARDEHTRTDRLRAHARHLRTHIDQLAAKSYWQHFDPTPEFVVLFVPADAFLNAALEQDPTLLEHAFERNVVIATPATLVALLRTIAYTWRQESLAENAQQVCQLGRELHGRLATMGGHMSRLGGQLESAVKHYNATVVSLEGRVLVTARKMTDLKIADDELRAPDQIELVARQLQAPELLASASDALVALPEPLRSGDYLPGSAAVR
ncbi:MAG: DNA recombination protein RmuC [Actinomycetota bacterium]|nr:DNA recombination protein RmuC [Actinomycetota bacterium]